MFYDLYGQSYSSSRDAENAEMAQCAEIDARIANHKVKDLERRIYEQQQYQDYEIQQKVDYLVSKIDELEKRIKVLETNK